MPLKDLKYRNCITEIQNKTEHRFLKLKFELFNLTLETISIKDLIYI